MKNKVLVIGKYDRYLFKIKFKSETVNELVLSLYSHSISKTNMILQTFKGEVQYS